jgi:glycosyltransferase involved in cell wall biosynthesis
MNILFVSPVVPSLHRGRRPYNLLKHLAAAGHRVRLLCLPYQGGTTADLAPLRDMGIDADLLAFSKTGALLRTATALASTTPLRVAYCNSSALKQILLTEIDKGDFDLLHCDRLRLSGILPDNPSLPVVLDLPDALDLYYTRLQKTSGSFKNKLLATIERRRIADWHRRLLPSLSATLVCSSVDKAHLAAQAPGARLELIANTVDVEEFSPKAEPRTANTLLFAGTLSYQPNVDGLNFFMREVWPKLHAENSSLKLRLVGTRPGKDAILAARQPGVELVGHVESMAAEMANATALVCPIRVASGTRIKLLEAMACETPVVSTTIGAEGLDVQHGREMLLADDATAFAKCIIEILSNPTLAKSLSHNSREYVLNHNSLEVVGNLLLEVYESLLR